MASSDTGTLDLTRVAAERRRLEAEAEQAARDAEIEHPAVVAQRIVEEVLRQAGIAETPTEREAVVAERDPDDPGAIARRIVADVLQDEGAIARAVAAASEVTGSRQADAAAAEIEATAAATTVEAPAPADEEPGEDATAGAPAADAQVEGSAVEADPGTATATSRDGAVGTPTADERTVGTLTQDEPAAVPVDGPTPVPFEARRTDLVYMVLPGTDDAPMLLMPGDTADPDTRPYVPELRPAPDAGADILDVRGWDGAALVDRALAPLVPATPAWRPAAAPAADPAITREAAPHRPGLTQGVAWIALAGMWLIAMAALVPLLVQAWVHSVDATPPDFWDDSAVVEDGAPAGDELEDVDPEELLDS